MQEHNHTWEEAQTEELEFWNTPGAELGEQLKQLTYAPYIGINFYHDGNSPYVIDKSGKTVVDIGGGPVSMLLKTNAKSKTVVDPCNYAKWVDDRYTTNDIKWVKKPAEDFNATSVDEFWLYNVLQHTTSPQQIFTNIYNSLVKGGVFRFLDWVETPTNVAHPITLTAEDIHVLLLQAGFEEPLVKTDQINSNGAVGKIAYGVFTK